MGIYPTVVIAGSVVDMDSLNVVQLVFMADVWRSILKTTSVASADLKEYTLLSAGHVDWTGLGNIGVGFLAGMFIEKRQFITSGTSTTRFADGVIWSNITFGAGPRCHAATCVAWNVCLPFSVSFENERGWVGRPLDLVFETMGERRDRSMPQAPLLTPNWEHVIGGNSYNFWWKCRLLPNRWLSVTSGNYKSNYNVYWAIVGCHIVWLMEVSATNQPMADLWKC